MKEIADGVGLDASCAVYPAYSSAETEPFGVLREYAGTADDGRGMWISPVKCGAGLRVRL